MSPFPTMFSLQSASKIPRITTVQLSSAASLNLGYSQNGVLGNKLEDYLNLVRKINGKT